MSSAHTPTSQNNNNEQGYFAPEVLALPLKASPFEGKSPEEAARRPSYDCKVDVWSAGVVCFEVLTGRAPFAAESVAQVLQVVLFVGLLNVYVYVFVVGMHGACSLFLSVCPLPSSS